MGNKTNFKEDFDEYLKLNPDFYTYFTDSSYFELADWYTGKYAKDICSEKNICEAYEFAKWVVDGMESDRPVNPGTRDHVVNIRDRYPNIDFDHFTDIDEFAVEFLKESGIDPFSFKYEEESCMSRRPQLDYDRLRVGDLLWYWNTEEPVPVWHEVVVTHLHGGIVFFRKTSGDGQSEKWLPTESIGYYLGLYPKKVIIPKGTTCTCSCPKTVFENEK